MKNKKYILIAVTILLLTVSFFLGDLSGGKSSNIPEKEEKVIQEASKEEKPEAIKEKEEKLEEDEFPKEEVEEGEPEEKKEEDKEEKKDLEKKDEKKEEEKKDKLPRKKTESKKEEKKPEEKKTARVSLKIDCRTILNNMDKLDQTKKGLVPDDGIIYFNSSLEIEEAETVFKLLQRELRNQGIHLDSSVSPAYNTNYVEGINNIYELDCGELSGWMYKVNGEFPNYGSSSYKLKDGDSIVWIYTCDLGRDIGGGGGSLGGE